MAGLYLANAPAVDGSWTTAQRSNYEIEDDFTVNHTVGAMPTKADTGQSARLTWNTTAAAIPVISNPGAGTRYTIASTVAGAQAGYKTYPTKNRVTKMICRFEQGVGIQAWQFNMPNGSLNGISTQGAVCHLAFSLTGWDYGVWNNATGLGSVRTYTYAAARVTSDVQNVSVSIDSITGTATVTGDDGVAIPVPASGTNAGISAYDCRYPCCEIYYNNAPTDPRAKVHFFKATSQAGGATGFPADPVDIVSMYLGPTVAWPGSLNLTDLFNRVNSADLGADYTPPNINSMKIVSNRADPTNLNVTCCEVRNDKSFRSNNHKVTLVAGGSVTNVIVVPSVRSASDAQVYGWVQVGAAFAIYTSATYAFTPATSRATGVSATAAVGDSFALEAVNDFYILRQNGVAVVIWNDANGAVYGANVNASHRDCVVAHYSAAAGAGVDTATWVDLADTLFYPSRMTKNGTLAWAVNATFADITAWLPVNDATYTSHVVTPVLSVITSKTGATLAASIPYTGSTAGRTHIVRIVRTRLANGTADSTVIATGANVTTAAGTATVSATANVLAGEQYKVQMQGSGATNGTITATTPTFTIS